MKENLEITRNHGGCPLKDDNIRNSGTPTVEVYDHDKPDRLMLMSPCYSNAVKATATSYTGNIVEWEWQHGTSATDMYAFTYDALARLTGAEHYRLSGTAWSVASNKFTEQGISYDRHGNYQYSVEFKKIIQQQQKCLGLHK